MGAMCVLCGEGRGGAIQGSADRGELPCAVSILGLGVGATCAAVGAPGFGFRVRRSAGLVVSGALRSYRVPSLGMLRGWVHALWKTVAADGCAWPSIFVNLGFL